MPHVVVGDFSLDAVPKGAERCRDANRRVAGQVTVAQVGEVKHDAGRNPEPPPPPVRGHRHVDRPGKGVGEIVERQGRLMGEDPELPSPEPGNDEVLVFADREVAEPVHASSHARHPARRNVLVEERTRIA